MIGIGIKIICLADTVGVSTPLQISFALNTLIPKYPSIEVGVHLHSTPENWKDKLQAAVEVKCTRFDGALKGFGGCPMAKDELVGNMNTEWMVSYFNELGILPSIDHDALADSLRLAEEIFRDQ